MPVDNSGCTCHISAPCWWCVEGHGVPDCVKCDGSGKVSIRRNSRGEIDYVDGLPTSEETKCCECDGTGKEEQ